MANAVVERVHVALPPIRSGAGIVIAPVGLPGMWHHMTRQLQQLGLAVVLPGGESPETILSLIERMRPSAIVSLPLVLSRLGELNRMRGAPVLPEGAQVFSGGDVLSEARRRRLSSLWGAPVMDFYGISEVFGPLASRDNHSATMRWRAPEVRVEIHHTGGRSIAPGETGVAVISTQWDRPADLRHYWTGDCFRLIEWAEPGVPVFEMRGRAQRNAELRPGVFVVDVDEALLADPSVLTEWKVLDTGDSRLKLQVEAIGQIGSETRQKLDEAFVVPPELETVAPGSLERHVLKLGLGLPR